MAIIAKLVDNTSNLVRNAELAKVKPAKAASLRWLIVSGDSRPTHGVDVTGDALQRRIASLEAHAEYLAGSPGHPPPRPMITGITAMQGQRMGVAHAVLFRVFDFHAPPPIALEAMKLAQADTPPS